MRGLICFAATIILLGMSSVVRAADLKVAILDCTKASCYGKKLSGPYKLTASDTCANLVQSGKLNFYNVAQVEAINKPLTGFTCAKAKAGQLICYPSVKGNGKC